MTDEPPRNSYGYFNDHWQPGPMTAPQVIDMVCRVCGESVWEDSDTHSHAWDAVAQVLDHYDKVIFQDIQRELTHRERDTNV